MEQKELLERIDRLEKQLGKLERRPGFLKRCLQRSNVLVGVVLGLLVTSGVLFAITKTYTFTDGTVISAAEMNTNFDEIHSLLNAGVYAQLSTDQGVSIGMNSKVMFDTALYGDGNFNTSTNTYTISAAGIYKIDFNLYDSNAATMCWKKLYVNGTTTNHPSGVVLELTTSDYIEIFMDCTSESALSANLTSADSYFMVRRLW